MSEIFSKQYNDINISWKLGELKTLQNVYTEGGIPCWRLYVGGFVCFILGLAGYLFHFPIL